MLSLRCFRWSLIRWLVARVHGMELFFLLGVFFLLLSKWKSVWGTLFLARLIARVGCVDGLVYFGLVAAVITVVIVEWFCLVEIGLRVVGLVCSWAEICGVRTEVGAVASGVRRTHAHRMSIAFIIGEIVVVVVVVVVSGPVEVTIIVGVGPSE